MRKITTLLLLSILIGFNVKAQNNFFNLIDESTIKIFYNTSADITIEKYADYFRIAEINSIGLFFHGQFTDFNNNGNKVFSGFFKKGQLNGECKYYYSNGEIKEIGLFKDGVREGIWNYFYENGQKQKIVDFKHGIPNILNTYNKKGKPEVIDGNGKYTGTFFKNNGQNKIYTVKGNLVNGKLDGKWTIKNITTEKFDYGKFIEGYDVLAYNNHQQISLETLFGFYCHENVLLFQNKFFCTSCINNISWALYNVNATLNIHPYEEFTNQIIHLYDSLNISQNSLLIEFGVEKDASIYDIKLKGSNKLATNEMIKSILKNIQWIPLQCEDNPNGYVYLMIVKGNGKIYVPQGFVMTNNIEANFMVKHIQKNDLMFCR